MNFQTITFEAAFWSYVGQTVAFSIGLLLVGRTSNRILLWLLANAIGLVAVFLMGIADTSKTGITPLAGVALQLTAVLIRGFSVGAGNLLLRRNRPGSIAAAISALAIILLIPVGKTDFRGILVVTSAICALAASYFYLAADRRSRGLAGTWQMQTINVLLIAVMGSQLLYVYPIGGAPQLFDNSQRTALGATALVALGTIWQIGFFSLVTGRNSRARVMAARHAARLEERSRLLRTRLSLTQDLANERLNLLRLMSHEVRQPLNNAQAALHALIEQRPSKDGTVTATTATRIQGILDDVILAISNSIIAASIIEWRRNPAMLPIGAADTLDLAVMDCSPEELRRIHVSRPRDEVFPNADPALLRLGLRNLLSNALKYSLPGSPINVVLLVDDDRQGIAYQVTNSVADTASMNGNLFDRGVRGGADGNEGSGLGLFMVSETARLHHGTIACWQLTPEHVTFELFIPL